MLFIEFLPEEKLLYYLPKLLLITIICRTAYILKCIKYKGY